MAKFTFNNTKNARTGHIFYKLNCKFHLCIFYKEDIHLCLRFCLSKKLTNNLKNLISICQQNLIYAQKIQKQANN